MANQYWSCLPILGIATGRQSSEHKDVENDQCCSLSHQGEQVAAAVFFKQRLIYRVR
jgi:hypothetical protein